MANLDDPAELERGMRLFELYRARAERTTEEEEVGVYLPGLSRPLYGMVSKREAGQVTVIVYHGDDRATITVDEDLVRPWRTKGDQA